MLPATIYTQLASSHTLRFLQCLPQFRIIFQVLSSVVLLGHLKTKSKTPKALICCQWNKCQDLLQIQCSRDPDLHLFMKAENKAAVRNAFTPS